jgi:hypothetical protein
MIPFSLKCTRCGTFTGKGTKANAKKEVCEGETYHGIKVLRFYVKCIVCANQLTYKTAPKNADYVCESGAVRNFEAQTIASREEEAEALERQAAREADDEEGKPPNAMQTLESRTMNSKHEMDVMDALDEIKALNQRHERIDTEALLRFGDGAGAGVGTGAAGGVGANGLTSADEEELKGAKFGRAAAGGGESSDSDADVSGAPLSASASSSSRFSSQARARKAQQQASILASKPKPEPVTSLGLAPTVVVRKRKAPLEAALSADMGRPPEKHVSANPTGNETAVAATKAKSALGALGGYGSSDSD